MTAYTRAEEWANSLTHAGGIVLGLVWGSFLLYRSTNNSAWLAAGVVLYMCGMLSSYSASTIYHAWKQNTVVRSWLRKFDHASIYLHIAGSYAPLTLGALRQVDAWGWGLFVWIQCAAVVGVIFSFVKLNGHSHFETVCFIIMGCSILVGIKVLWDNVPHSCVYWILAEGVMFIVGALFYSMHKYKFMHTVFHVFVLLGTVCHLMALEQVI